MKRTRRAIFLVEVALAMALASILLGVTLALLAAVLRADPVAPKGFTTSTELDRFTDRLRRDLHRAESVTTPEPNELLLKSDAREIVYELGDRQCERRERTGRGDEHTTRFAVDATSWRVNQAAELGRFVTVTLEMPSLTDAQTLLEISVTAQLNKYGIHSALEP